MKRALALGALVVALGGCRALPVAPIGPPDDAGRAALAALPAWHATGRVAVRAGAEGFSASFDWREAGGHGELGVHGPFGAGGVRLERSAERIVIESAGAPPLAIAAPFEALEPQLVARLGFPLPLEPLRFWVLGVPAPGLPVDGGGSEFRQAGWQVSVGAFVAVAGAPAPLPARLTLAREGTRIRV
ncbi:MAG: outer membrane lipoprotein LolB, partial [Proteobacteria bacterium]|nr:outer membrane lipoprotein LolB [Pseudomonadota bacterium]